MRREADVARGWIRKAESDVVAMEATLKAGSLDAACFHAQQSAEKYLKAYLADNKIAFPPTHNLAKLVLLCRATDESFESLLSTVEPLTPYAVQLRYDGDFWPTIETAKHARSCALEVKQFVLGRLPAR